MIQEKYNQRIYDEGTEESIQNFSHLRSNVLSPVGIGDGDNVLIIDPDSQSLVEWLDEQSNSVTACDSDNLQQINSTFNIIISLGQMTETPTVLKKLLSAGGRLVYAFPEKTRQASFAKKLLAEAGFTDVITYRVSPDYLYTTEIYAEDYAGGGAGDYLLIAR